MTKKLLHNRRFWIVWITLGLILLALVAFEQFSLSALDEPSEVETFVATHGKRLLVGKEAAEVTPVATVRTETDLAFGNGLFVAQCSSCHGVDGRTPTEMGRRMYPRAVDLGSAHVQGYSDAEMFWIVKNGIRLTGMPGLGDSQPDDNIWRLVQFLRTLPENPS